MTQVQKEVLTHHLQVTREMGTSVEVYRDNDDYFVIIKEYGTPVFSYMVDRRGLSHPILPLEEDEEE